MGDPFTVATGVVGIVSLGIQVIGGLAKYYAAVRDRDGTIDRTTTKLQNLLSILTTLDTSLRERKFRSDERSILSDIEQSVNSCEELIGELKNELDKFSAHDIEGFVSSVKAAGRRVTYPFRQSTLQKLDEDNAELRDNLALALQCLQLNDASHVRNDVEDIKSLINLVRGDQVSGLIRAWFQAPDVTLNHNQACAKRHPRSGLWLTEGRAFTSWLGTNNSFLWLHGFAGCGKSVLCSTAIQHTFRHRRSDPRIGVAFFYFSFNDVSKQSASSMLKALILQLSTQTKSGSELLTRLHGSYSNGTPPDIVLTGTLRTLVSAFDNTFLLIDALDESPQDQLRDNVLQVLEDFQRWNLSGLHILVTSRDLPDIRDSLECLGESVSMKNDEVSKDIENFISGHLEAVPALSRWSPDQQTRIKQTLVAGAHGSFRWVECQFRSLAQCPRSEAALKRRLVSLPPSLDDTYERMLLNIDPESIEDARRVLTLLCFAMRPLTVLEVIDAIAVDLGDDPNFDLERRFRDESDILRICPGFIEVGIQFDEFDGLFEPKRDPSLVLRIAHFSVQEYLESARICGSKAAKFALSYRKAHQEFTQICVIYLLDCYRLETLSEEALLQKRPFVDYSASRWYRHISKSLEGTTSKTQKLVIDFLNLQDDRTLQFHDPDHHVRLFHSPTVKTSLYYASLLGLDFVLSDSLKHDIESGDFLLQINQATGEAGTPLHAASYAGHDTIAKVLLKSGAHVNAVSSKGLSPLHCASQKGHKSVAKLLLDNGANISLRTYKGKSALHVASSGGHLEIVAMLLDCGAEINCLGGQYQTVLQEAADGSAEVVRYLLDHGADVNATGGWYFTALQAASFFGHASIVATLLSYGANPNAHGGWMGNALNAASYHAGAWNAASEREYVEIVSLLLEHGAKPESDGEHCPLITAAVQGRNEVVAMLLQHGAEVNAESGYWRTALRAAVGNGQIEIVQMLIGAGATIDLVGVESIVELAMNRGEEIAKILINAGANVNGLSDEYGTIVHSALCRGYTDIAEMLTERGANDNSQARLPAST